jgi:hypothetical protein
VKQKKLIIRESVAFLIFLAGCTTNNPGSKISQFVIPADCKSGCWAGIKPGITTKDEVVDILDKLYSAENVSIDNSSGNGWYIEWTSNEKDWSHHGTVVGSGDEAVEIWVFLAEGKVGVKDLLQALGEPYSVGLVVSGPGVKCAGALLLYPNTGLEVFLSPVDNSVGVTNTQFIDGLRIVPPWPSEKQPLTDTVLVRWDGYHEYCPKSWPWEK